MLQFVYSAIYWKWEHEAVFEDFEFNEPKNSITILFNFRFELSEIPHHIFVMRFISTSANLQEFCIAPKPFYLIVAYVAVAAKNLTREPGKYDDVGERARM